MSISKVRPEVAAIYCPLWHPYDHMNAWHGQGWCEWELLKTAPQRFPEHYQPFRPTWGYYDESDPKWAAREIDLAADHGIDVFLFDWYWYSGVRLMEEAVENGFLKAPNRDRLKFALMWANHDWADYFPAPYGKAWNSWLPMRHSSADMVRVIDYGIAHYFRQPNYWRVEGRLFFSVFRPHTLLSQLGGPNQVKSLLASLDDKLKGEGLPPIHWNAMGVAPDFVSQLYDAGFHSITNYNIMHTGKTSTNLTEQYDDLIDKHLRVWEDMGRKSLPYCPVVTMGWDVTARCEHHVAWPFENREYPYSAVVVGNTPQSFARLCRHAAEFAAADPQRFAVFINAWNEWTEGAFLLPEERYGTAYIEAIGQVFGGQKGGVGAPGRNARATVRR